MAAGGYWKGRGIPLRDRGRRGAGEPPAPPPAPIEPPCPARHCWVSLPVDSNSPRPGLLLEWRKVELGRFEGLVIYPAQLRTGRWATVTEWVPAELLTGAD